MFGYVKAEASELLVREYDFYRAVYCGICRGMKKHTGCLSNLSLSYDTVFLALVRMMFGREKLTVKRKRCIAHPIRGKNAVIGSPGIEYTARSNSILTYLKVRDDFSDGTPMRKVLCSMILPYLRHSKKRAKIPELEKELSADIARLSELERAKVRSVDATAGVFGELLGRVFAYGLDDDDGEKAYDVGYYLGKVIYEFDAFDDYGDDVKKKNYNPYVALYGDGGLDAASVNSIKTGIYVELTFLEKAVTALDFRDADAAENIIKNIIYLGLTKELCKIAGKYVGPAENDKETNK